MYKHQVNVNNDKPRNVKTITYIPALFLGSCVTRNIEIDINKLKFFFNAFIHKDKYIHCKKKSVVQTPHNFLAEACVPNLWYGVVWGFVKILK